MRAQEFLAQDPWTFDQTSSGWRSLSQPRAITALRDYISKYVRQGQFVNVPKGNKTLLPNTLYWHLGQLLAMAGDNASAVASMRNSLSGDPDWDAYVRATVAFLANNRKAFDQYVDQPNSNKETIDRLAANWGKSYKDAY
jgi:hypothetical protein